MKAAVVFALRALIRAYQLCLAPLIGPVCRFTPSCSVYAAEAIAVHGPVRGVALSAARLCRCHPWGGSGHDPVPERPVPGQPVLGPVPSRLHCTSVRPTS